MLLRTLFLCFCLSAWLPVMGRTIANPTRHPYERALIRLNPEEPLPASVSHVTVRRDGEEVPGQIEDGVVWAAVDLGSGERAKYDLAPAPGTPVYRKRVTTRDDRLILWNRHLAIAVPARMEDPRTPPGPILGFRRESDSEWKGGSEWISAPPATSYGVEVIGDGPVFAKVRLRYQFGEHWAELDITLPPDRPFALIESRHSMREGDGWRFLATRNLEVDTGVMRRWYKGPFQGAPAEERFPLEPGVTRLGETVIHLQPRWTQSYDEGWSFGVAGTESYVGALVIRPGQWRWPHDNKPSLRVRDGGGWAGFDLPTHRGARTWLLLFGDADLAAEVPGIARRESFLNPDKLTHTYRLPFEPGEKKLIGGGGFSSNQTNPTGMMRQQNRRRLRDAQKGNTTTSLGALYQAQAFFDPDWYGLMEHGWSPINPNFYTDFIKGGVALAAQLRNHSEFDHVRGLAEEALRRDMLFAVTLPGGAGQECPGYQEHAMSAWREMAPVCREHLGFDPASWPRFTEGARFLARISVPTETGRKFHPAGDTHPNRPDPLEWAGSFGVVENPAGWGSEAFPGFGTVFRHRSGDRNETFLSFKAGPNRGHYHGDQLSIHWVSERRPLAVDHHASYKPRPGQEHMHNRLSFSVDGMPYANMDGHERLLAFRATPVADVAVAEVASPRLREVKPLPPEEWDVSEPSVPLDTPLRYRRTVVFLKQDPPVVVLVDEWEGPEVHATWNLHVTGDRAEREGDWIDFGNAQTYLPAEAGERYQALPWEHENGGLEKTTAGRVTRTGRSGRFVSVLVPGTERPDARLEGDRLRIGDITLTFRPEAGIVYAGERTVPLLKPEDIDPDRSQGEVGLFVPDVGYPFGPLPDWLIEQRAEVAP